MSEIMLPVAVDTLGAVMEAIAVSSARAAAKKNMELALSWHASIERYTRDVPGLLTRDEIVLWQGHVDYHLEEAAACEMRANWGQWPEERV